MKVTALVRRSFAPPPTRPILARPLVRRTARLFDQPSVVAHTTDVDDLATESRPPDPSGLVVTADETTRSHARRRFRTCSGRGPWAAAITGRACHTKLPAKALCPRECRKPSQRRAQ